MNWSTAFALNNYWMRPQPRAMHIVLAEVSRRFFHTRAGYEATFLLGLDHLDHGRPLAGALTLQRLVDSSETSDQFEPALSLAMATGWLQAGSPEKAREALLAFRKNHPQLAMKVAAGQVPLFTNSNEALDWLKKLVGTDAGFRVGRSRSLADVPRQSAAQCDHQRQRSAFEPVLACRRRPTIP